MMSSHCQALCPHSTTCWLLLHQHTVKCCLELATHTETSCLQALVPLLAHRDDQIRDECCATIKHLLLSDVSGKTSLEALQLVADLVRKRKCVVSPAVVSSLLVFRFEQVTPTAQGGEGVGGKVRLCLIVLSMHVESLANHK